MSVKCTDHMGSDLSIVNAARVSFGKHKKHLDSGDNKLINYLAEHNHWSPFGHASLQFHIEAPIFVARQLVKHQIGLTWNEVSRRYVNDDPTFHKVDRWRGKPIDKKQGSSDETVDTIWTKPDGTLSQRTDTLKTQVEDLALENYKIMISAGVAPEQARMILPQSMMTQWYWSGTLYAFARVCSLRCKPDAQMETKVVADEIDSLCRILFPISWEALRGKEIDGTHNDE
jgi:thymidylate synthase (FAD)